jgi:hypothetical protein
LSQLAPPSLSELVESKAVEHEHCVHLQPWMTHTTDPTLSQFII